MLIEGPFKLSIMESDSTSAREMHVKFTQGFKDTSPAQRIQTLDDYVSELETGIAKIEGDNPERQGMQLVLQIAQQLRSYIVADELELDQTIIIELQEQNTLNNLISREDLH